MKMQRLLQLAVLFQAVCRECGQQINVAATMQNMDTPVWDMKWQQHLV